MCGLVGVVTSNDVGVCLYDTLTVLQHRGQDASGILTNYDGKIALRKSLGLVRDGFSSIEEAVGSLSYKKALNLNNLE